MLLLFLLLLADPQAAANLLRKGLLALQAGQAQQAQATLQQAAELDGNNAYIWSSLAETHRALKETVEAFAAAEKAGKLGKGDPVLDHSLAIFYTQMDQPGKAAPFELAFARSPKADPDALERVAALYLRANDLPAAVKIAQEAVKKHASSGSELTLAQALTAAGQNAGALPHWQKAWDLSDKGDPQLAFECSRALLQAQKFTEAAAVAEQVLAVQKGDAQLQLVLGVARYGQRRFQEAVAAFLDVIAIDPAIPQPYLFLSNLLEQAGPYLDRVIAADEAWAQREPDNERAQITLAKALLQKDRKSERAKNLLTESIRLNDRDWEAHYQLGVLLENSRDYPAAAVELKRSTERNERQALPHYHLARVYDRLGQPEQAKSEREIHAKLTGSPLPNSN